MVQITKGSQYIAFALYSLCYCCWGSRPALSSGGDETAFRNARSPNSCSRLSLNLITGPQTKHQKGKNGRGRPPPEKKEKKEKIKRRDLVVGFCDPFRVCGWCRSFISFSSLLYSPPVRVVRGSPPPVKRGMQGSHQTPKRK